jgi:galactoside O-acetyltransferase
MIEEDKTNVTGGEVIIRKYSQVGAGCTIMPNLTIEEGVAVGAMSFINKSLQSWGIYAGIPAIRIKDRNIKLLELI